MLLSDIERHSSRAQTLSIVDSMRFKIALWFGSVSAGKTVASLFAFLIAVRMAPSSGLIVIVGKSLQTVYQNVFVLFQNTAIFGSLISSQISYTPGATTARILGREVMIVGANDAKAVGRIQGATIALAYVDEAALMPEAFWNMLVSRLRVEGARLLATMNPASRNHWMRKKWIIPGAAKNVISFHFTMLDNPNLPADYISDMEASYTGVFYDRMIKGEWTNAAGAIYPMWDPARHVIPWEKMPPIRDVYGYGMDYGTTNATTAMMLGITDEDRPRLIFLDEWGYASKDEANNNQRLTDVELSKRFVTWHKTKHAPFPIAKPKFLMIDSAAASFKQQLMSEPDLLDAGLMPWSATHKVTKGIATVANLLATDRLIVTDRCERWNGEVTEYQWDEKATDKGNDEPLKEDDHWLDGGRYIIQGTKNYWEHELAA